MRIKWLMLFISILLSTSHATAALSPEDAMRIQMQMKQMSQTIQQNQLLNDSTVVRPSPRERGALQQLLIVKPRPKTLSDADIKYLKELLDRPTWFGYERRIMHEIWTEVSGKDWSESEASQPTTNDASP